MNTMDDHRSLTQGRLLARNMLLNLLGYGTPLLVAIVAIPIMVRYMGTERFGMLTLAWVIIGYLSLLDLGLGRALTKLVAEKLGTGHTRDMASLVWTTLLIMIMLGILIGIIAAILTPFFVSNVLKIPIELNVETLHTFYLLCASVPIVIISVGFRGLLEAHQRFDLINAVRIPIGIYSFSAPLIVLPFSTNLFFVVLVMVAGKIIACMVQLLFCRQVMPSLKQGISFQRSDLGDLFKFGSWMTITNVVSPLLMYIDRFFITALISVVAVAYYATPSEVVTKVLLISGALMGVLFPAFSTSFNVDRERCERMFNRGMKYIFLVIFPISLLLITCAHEGLQLWLGSEFSKNSARVLQWVTGGVLLLSIGQVPYALIQGAGRPDLTAKLHMVEMLIYIPIIFVLTTFFGIQGVAFAWMLRAAADTLCMYYLATKLLGSKRKYLKQGIGIGILAGLILCAGASLPNVGARIFYVCFVFIAYLLTAWYVLLAQDERHFIVNRFLTSNRDERMVS